MDLAESSLSPAPQQATVGFPTGGRSGSTRKAGSCRRGRVAASEALPMSLAWASAAQA